MHHMVILELRVQLSILVTGYLGLRDCASAGRSNRRAVLVALKPFYKSKMYFLLKYYIIFRLSREFSRSHMYIL